MSFKGYPASKVHLTPLPEPFFSDLLPQIDHLGELKLTLYVFWRLDRMTGEIRYLRLRDFVQDDLFMRGLSADPQQAAELLADALQRATARGSLLMVDLAQPNDKQTLYFLNSAKGRQAVEAIRSGKWLPKENEAAPSVLHPTPPNIFRLYEENIGPLTPIIAEALGEAEDTYPASWIEEAFRIAIERNVRNWRYIDAILKRWQREGRHATKEDGRDAEKTGRDYIEGELSDYIKH